MPPGAERLYADLTRPLPTLTNMMFMMPTPPTASVSTPMKVRTASAP
jgi:hypothetical protein